MSLKEYHRKRDFKKNPEPADNGPDAPGRLFVIQKHAARRLHYDFRLELDGVLKSWAVPKGPCLDPSVKALAVHVEDHPLQYADFEGIIPKGQYGGGTVLVWDRGSWKPVGDPKKGYKSGKLKFHLHGEKLNGGWSLVRMGGQAGEGGKNWLLIKQGDGSASTKIDIQEKEPRSVLTGREMQEIAADADRVWESNGATKKSARKKTLPKKSKAVAKPAQATGARKAKLPGSFKPQLAKLASQVPGGDRWLHELKFDGYRLLALFHRGTVRLITRNGNDWTQRFPTIATALEKLPIGTAIWDGEIVSLNKEGQSDFQQLQNLMKRGNDEDLVYFLFDQPYLEGYDLTGTPLLERKELLARLLLNNQPGNDGVLRYSDHIQGQGRDVLAHACRYAMEGVVSKKADSAYQQTRAASWLKIKCLHRQEFVIGGYTEPSGSRIGFGALLLGYYEGEQFLYAGRVGTGFTNETLKQVHAELKRIRTEDPPFANPPRGSRAAGVTWVELQLVGEVEFTEWTNDGLLRHPSFQGLREDKPAEQVVREVVPTEPQKEGKSMNKSKRQKARPSHSETNSSASSGKNGDAVVAGVRISHPERVLYPEQGVTKLELARFYEDIADWALPYIENRPLTLVRCPRGRSGDCFYQKHLTDSLPDALRGVEIKEKGKRAEYVVIDDLPGLISLVQMGVLELHPWPAKADQLEEPDLLVLDLDPGPGVAWADVVEGARDVRDRLQEFELESFIRTSGGKGLHVVVPIQEASWDAAKDFAKLIATNLAYDYPDSYVATSSKAKRQGKVFIDFLRNSRGATAVASYSTRARPGAPVAVPLRWEELGKIEAANQYTIANLKRRLGALKSDPWQDFWKKRQSLRALNVR